MSDKLLSYLDSFPDVCSIWVNPQLEYTTGPAEGFVKMSRDMALEAVLYLAFPVDEQKEELPNEKEPTEDSEPEGNTVVKITKPPKNVNDGSK